MYGSRQTEPERATSHEAVVAAIAQFLKPKVYVELGACHGSTYARVLPHIEMGFAVEIENFASDFAGMPRTTFVQKDTVAFLDGMADESIDLCFLDSSHEYDATIREFGALSPKVKDNGVVLFHDSYPPNDEFCNPGMCGMVYKAVDTLKRAYGDRWEFATLPAQYGVTIARKNLGKQVLWS